MKLDRALIKSQAKQIIKDCFFGLFLISIVVSTLTTVSTPSVSGNSSKEINDIFDNNNLHYFDDFTGSDDKPDINHFKNFTGRLNLFMNPIITGLSSLLSASMLALSIAMLPLCIALSGLYIETIHGKKMKIGQYFSYVFKNTFNKTYFSNLGLVVLRDLFIFLFSLLLIVPGIVCAYNYYFAFTIKSQNPYISAKEALRLSKDLTRGHRGELFALDLSFLGWFLLIPLSLGGAAVYVIPYYNTTKALYYENFRIRAIQENNPSSMFFMTAEQRIEFMKSQNDAKAEATPEADPIVKATPVVQDTSIVQSMPESEPIPQPEPVIEIPQQVEISPEPSTETEPIKEAAPEAEIIPIPENGKPSDDEIGSGMDTDYFNSNY